MLLEQHRHAGEHCRARGYAVSMVGSKWRRENLLLLPLTRRYAQHSCTVGLYLVVLYLMRLAWVRLAHCMLCLLDPPVYSGRLDLLWRSIEERREEKDGLAVMKTSVLGFGAGRGPDNRENHIFLSCMSRRLFRESPSVLHGNRQSAYIPVQSILSASTKQFHFLTLHVRGCIILSALHPE